MEPTTPDIGRRLKPQELDLTEVHHPKCPYGRMSVRQRRRALDASTPQLPAETHKAIEAVRFVSAHLKNEDDFGEVKISYKMHLMLVAYVNSSIAVVAVVVSEVIIIISA